MGTPQSNQETILLREAKRTWQMLFLLWLIALISTLSVLFIGEIMGQEPCVLCWYQRAFMFPLAVILGVACYLSDPGVWRYALPVASLGWIVAVYHNLLIAGLIPKAIKPCGPGPSCSGTDMIILGVIPIPVLSIAAFSALIVLSLLIRKRVNL